MFSKINQHGDGCPGQQMTMKEVLAGCWGHLLPLTDQPNPERSFWMFQKTLWGKKGKKNNRGRNISRERVSVLGSRCNIAAHLEDCSLWFDSLNFSP